MAARQRYDGALVDTAGNVLVGGKVRFYRRNTDGTSSGVLASTEVYTTENGSTLVTYPLTTDSYGRVAAYAEPGAYYVEVRASNDTTVLQPDQWDAAPMRQGAIPWKQLAEPARAVPLFSRMSVNGHSLAFGGGATDVDRDMMTHLASMLQVREMNYSKGGAILSWHNVEPDTTGNGGYASVLNNHLRTSRYSTTVNANYTTGTTLTVAGTGVKTGDYISVGTGTNSEAVYVATGGVTGLTLKNALSSSHSIGEPVVVIPSEYLAGSPFYVGWYGINDLAVHNNTAMSRKFIEPLRSIINRFRAAEFYNNNSTIFVKTGGTWGEDTPASSPNFVGQATYGTQSVFPAGGGTLTCHVPANAPGTDVVLYFVIAPTVNPTGNMTFTVDGASAGSLDVTGSTLCYQTSGGKYNLICKRFTGLSAGRHTIVATMPSYSGFIATVGFDGMSITAAQPPLTLIPGLNRPLNYTVWPSWDNSQTTTTFTSLSGTTITVGSTTGMIANDTVSFANGNVRTVVSVTNATQFVVNTALTSTPTGGSSVVHGMQDSDIAVVNGQITSLVAEYDNRVVYVDMDTVINKTAAYFWHDGTHFSDKGHAVGAMNFRDTVFAAEGASPDIPAYLSVPTNPLPSEIVVLGGAPVGDATVGGATANVGRWLNMPAGTNAAPTELFGGAQWRQLVDLKRAKEWRWYIGVTAAGAASSFLRVQYSIDSGATWKYFDRRNGDLAEDPARTTRPMQLAISAAGWFSTGWHDVPPESMIDATILRIVGVSSVSTGDPSICSITLQFR